jgi:hypothetical protein
MSSPTLRLRLRLPRGERIASIQPRLPFNARTGTIDLSDLHGPIDLAVSISGAY